jgi:hypothetical protein
MLLYSCCCKLVVGVIKSRIKKEKSELVTLKNGGGMVGFDSVCCDAAAVVEVGLAYYFFVFYLFSS